MLSKKENVLPSEYRQLEYIASNRKPFKTGFIPTIGCRIELTFQGSNKTANKAGAYFGCRTSYQNNHFYLSASASSASATTINMRIGWNKSDINMNVNVDASDKHTYGINNGEVYIDDTVLYQNSGDFSPTAELYLLAVNQNDTSIVGITSPVGDLYGSKIWDDNGLLVRDYIPVERLSDNTQGLYDFVHDVFITQS